MRTMENGKEKQSSLLAKRYMPFRGSFSIKQDKNKMNITIDAGEEIQKVRDILCHGDAYSRQSIEDDLYEEVKADWDKLFHLLILKKINGIGAMIEMMKSINSRFDKDKEYII